MHHNEVRLLELVDGEIVPTKEGLALSMVQWTNSPEDRAWLEQYERQRRALVRIRLGWD